VSRRRSSHPLQQQQQQQQQGYVVTSEPEFAARAHPTTNALVQALVAGRLAVHVLVQALVAKARELAAVLTAAAAAAADSLSSLSHAAGSSLMSLMGGAGSGSGGSGAAVVRAAFRPLGHALRVLCLESVSELYQLAPPLVGGIGAAPLTRAQVLWLLRQRAGAGGSGGGGGGCFMALSEGALAGINWDGVAIVREA